MDIDDLIEQYRSELASYEIQIVENQKHFDRRIAYRNASIEKYKIHKAYHEKRVTAQITHVRGMLERIESGYRYPVRARWTNECYSWTRQQGCDDFLPIPNGVLFRCPDMAFSFKMRWAGV